MHLEFSFRQSSQIPWEIGREGCIPGSIVGLSITNRRDLACLTMARLTVALKKCSFMIFVINIIKSKYTCICICMFFLPFKEVAMWVLDYDFFSDLFLSGLLELWKAFWFSFGYNNILQLLKISSRLRLAGVLKSINPI